MPTLLNGPPPTDPALSEGWGDLVRIGTMQKGLSRPLGKKPYLPQTESLHSTLPLPQC